MKDKRMTQEEFDKIKEELLAVSTDTWYTEGDLYMLAQKYNLDFSGNFHENEVKHEV